MTYKVSPSTYRLGYSISWSAINSPIFFYKGLRLNIFLNTYIKGFFKMQAFRLVRWFFNVETVYIK